MGDRLLTVEDIAERLALTPRVVRAWLRDGKIPGIKLGREWRISEKRLDEYIRDLHERA